MIKARDLLVALTIKNKGSWEKTMKDLKEKRDLSEKEINELLATIGDTKFITILDNEYPQKLKQGYKPPFVLFYKGNLNLLNEDSIAITTSKNTNTRDMTIANKLVKELKGKTIINCVRNDNESVINALADKSIIVLDYGALNGAFEYENELFITEIPAGEVGTQESLQRSYMIMTALCKNLVIIKADNQTDTIVARALQNGNDIYVLPHPLETTDIGNKYIVEGAIPLVSIEQLTSMPE